MTDPIRPLRRALVAGGLLSLMVFSMPGSAQDQAGLSDEFSDPGSLSRWIPYHVAEGWPDHMKRMEVKGGNLELEPWTSGWYAEFHAPFLYKKVAGDFSVTTHLQARGKASDLPGATWSLTGLMVRQPPKTGKADWKPGQENWLFLTTGIAEEPGKPVFETKTTVNSRSRLKLHPARAGWVELRIDRAGPTFTLLYRYPGEDWVTLERFERPDLPKEVQVGLNVYTDWYSARDLHEDPLRFNSTVIKEGKPDLVTLVDYVRFGPAEMLSSAAP
jgi:hypothetical protein